MTAKLSDADRERGASIIALFVSLIHAWLRHDREETANCQREIEEHGVRVSVRESTVSHD